MDIEKSGWSGEGRFTQVLVDALGAIVGVRSIRVEDAPASRAESGYNFIANEIYVTFATRIAREPARFLGIVPYSRKRPVAEADLDQLTAIFTADPEIGEPDYADEGLIQYLRTERVVAPYQTRGVKIVELVRIYRAGAPRR